MSPRPRPADWPPEPTDGGGGGRGRGRRPLSRADPAAPPAEIRIFATAKPDRAANALESLARAGPVGWAGPSRVGVSRKGRAV